MALSLDPATKVISVPQADLAFVSGTLYSLNTDTFRKNVFDLLASEDYMWMPDAYQHNGEVTVAGTTFARTLEFVNGYSITFEDTGATYSVRLEGSNNNIFDVDNGVLNPTDKLTVIPTNSAGLIGSKQIDDQSFGDERVWIDIDAGQAGTQFPIGTPGSPVDNLADAQTIISNRTLPKRLHVRGTLPIGASDNIDAYDILGVGSLLTTVTFTSGASNANARITGANVSGDMSGELTLNECTIGAVTGLQGEALESGLSATATISGDIRFVKCYSDIAGTGRPIIDCNSVASLDAEVRGYHGGLEIQNYNQAGNNMSIDGDSIRLTLDSTCTNGVIVVGGAGNLTDDSAGSVVNVNSFNQLPVAADVKIDEIYKRLDLAGDQTYANDGSIIANNEFTLTKVDNGDGTFDITRS